MNSSSQNNTCKKAATEALSLALCESAALIIKQSLLIAGPFEVLKSLTLLLGTKEFYLTVVYSLSRIGLGFAYGFAFACLLAFFSYKSGIFEKFLYPYVLMAKSIPVASFVILALMYLGAKKLAVFISFIMVFPIIYTNILTGLKEVDSKLLDFSKVYNINGFRKLHYILIPEIFQYVISAVKTASGMAWKSGVAAEIIGLSRNSIGYKLYEAKIYFSISDLFAWTLVIILLSLGFEKLLIFILNGVYSYAYNQ